MVVDAELNVLVHVAVVIVHVLRDVLLHALSVLESAQVHVVVDALVAVLVHVIQHVLVRALVVVKSRVHLHVLVPVKEHAKLHVVVNA